MIGPIPPPPPAVVRNGPASIRDDVALLRRELDRLIAAPPDDHARDWATYNRAMLDVLYPPEPGR